MNPSEDPRLFGGLAAAASATPARAAPVKPGALPGDGVTDTAELVRLVGLLRASEAASAPTRRDIVIGEFTVSGPRVPDHHIAVLQHLTQIGRASCRERVLMPV